MNKKMFFTTFAPALVFVLIMVVLQTSFSLTVAGQGVKENSSISVEEDSKLSAVFLSRPLKMKSLRQYVKRNFASNVDEDSISETWVGEKSAVIFSHINGNKTVDSIIIDNGDGLELHSDTYPTSWKYESTTEDIGSKFTINSPPDIDEKFLAASVPTCAGVASPGNPYPCCSITNGGSAVYGNCTFAAWYHAKRFWGYSMPTWGGNGASNAKYWYDKSRASGIPTSLTPALYSIAVSSTLAPDYGHVAWVMEITGSSNNTMLLVYEQSCGSSAQGITQKWRSISTFNKGYVLSPVSAPSPTLSLVPYPQINSSSSTQAIKFNVSNVNPGARAVVTFPDGGRATLKDSQLNLSNGVLTTYMVLNARGYWNIQLFNENGKFSGLYRFYVN